VSAHASSTPAHWDAAYAAGDTTRGWYQPEATMSMRLVAATGLSHAASIVDVGSGASVLVDDLLAAGYADITCIDHSPIGLRVARDRLGERAASVTWIVEDLLTWTPSRTFDVWHDRAVLHFLLDDAAVAAYRRALLAGTSPGSWLVLGVFGPQGPQMCAGLPVRRYDDARVDAMLGTEFTRVQAVVTDHVRPDGDTQEYLWTLARRDA
jgi:SAM-dependent methyltransferase